MKSGLLRVAESEAKGTEASGLPTEAEATAELTGGPFEMVDLAAVEFAESAADEHK